MSDRNSEKEQENIVVDKDGKEIKEPKEIKKEKGKEGRLDVLPISVIPGGLSRWCWW